jgi:hypothetical protein
MLGARCSVLPSHLRVKIARLAAIDAIVLAILAQSDIVRAVAQAAVALALATCLFLVTLETNECVSHFASL